MAEYLKKGDLIGNLNKGRIVGTCPECGHALVVRTGRFGKFIGCSGFRHGCRKTYKMDTFRIYDQSCIDRINLDRAVWNVDLKMAEHINRTCSSSLKLRASAACEDIWEAMLL